MGFVKEVGEIWLCDVCGNVVEVKKVGGGALLCCGGPMTKVEPGTPAQAEGAE
jgi:desulfoferrodoxin-like iron-binding protein